MVLRCSNCDILPYLWAQSETPVINRTFPKDSGRNIFCLHRGVAATILTLIPCMSAKNKENDAQLWILAFSNNFLMNIWREREYNRTLIKWRKKYKARLISWWTYWKHIERVWESAVKCWTRSIRVWKQCCVHTMKRTGFPKSRSREVRIDALGL